MAGARGKEPWLPDLCRLPRVGTMLGLAELAVVVVVLVPDGSRTWDVRAFLSASGYALWLALAVSVLLYVFPVDMPPPPGRSVGYPLNISIDPTLYLLTMGAMVGLTLLASLWVARNTVHMPVVDALAHT